VLPAATRVALLANPQHPGEPREREAAQAAAARFGMKMRYFAVSTDAELDAALADVARAQDQAIVAFADGFMMSYAGRIASFSAHSRIPAVDGWAPFAREGNLMTYGPVFEEVYRRLAAYVDRIRKGANPADIPVELPTRMELVINLKVARALGIAIPEALLVRADDVIR
jgi:putative ABC transport system substrate-binding protein